MSGLHPRDPESRARLRAGLLSLGVALLLLAAKLEAYRRTGSAAVLSDALESIVNVVAAAFGIGSILFAGRPADRNHPYGHGKIEYFSAAFEGGLIAFAALLIVYEALQAFVLGVELRDLDVGLAIVLGAGLANAALGLFLVRTGRRNDSLTLVADGKHVLSDWWTSAGIVVGLLLVRWTGIVWLDPLVACLVALQLFWTGARLVREAARGLLDEEDPELLARLVQVLGARLGGGFVHLHHLRAPRRALPPRRRAPGRARVLAGRARPRALGSARRRRDPRPGRRGRARLPHRPVPACLLRQLRPGRLPGARRALPPARAAHGRGGGAAGRGARAARRAPAGPAVMRRAAAARARPAPPARASPCRARCRAR